MQIQASVFLSIGILWVSAATAGDGAAATPPQVTDVWVVFKTHFDLGFTDLAENVFTRYRVNMMERALGLIEQNRTRPPDERFVWTVPGWPLSQVILGPKQDPARRQRIEQAVKEGSLAVHALPFSMHTESLDLEDLVRGLGYSSRIARTYGRPLPIGSKMTDVAEHCWVMPVLLAHAGIRFLQIGCNGECQYARFPPLFRWEGPDGSRVLCNYTRGYGSGIVPPSGWPSKNYLAMITTSDNVGPPSAADVDTLLREARQKLPGVRIHFGTLDDFARAVETENPDLPIVHRDAPDTWIHGPMSMPQETKTARNIRPLEPALESLDTHLRAWGLAPAPVARLLAEAYENSLLYGEHTWGLNSDFGPQKVYGDAWQRWLVEAEAEKPPAGNDYSHVANGSKKKWLKSYDDHRNYIRKTHEIVTRELRARLDLLASSVETDGPRIVVYNPLPWPRSGIVDVPQGFAPPSAIKDLVTGKTVAVAEGRFLAAHVPANGYKTFVVGRTVRQAFQPDAHGSDAQASHCQAGKPDVLHGQDDHATSTLETRFYQVRFDLKRGGIASLVQKESGRELADQSSPYILGQFLHERFSAKEADHFYRSYSRFVPSDNMLRGVGKPGMPDADQSPYLATTPGDWRLSVSRTEVADTATLAAGREPAFYRLGHHRTEVADTAKGLAKAYSISFTFPRHAAWVEVQWTVSDKTADKIPEGGWLCFPFAVPRPRFTVGHLGGAMDPARDIVPGANRHLMAVSSGVAMTGANGGGAAICPLDSPLVSLGRPGLWEWTLDYVPKTPTVFVNLYNNMFNTNFPLWQDGSWSERVRLWPVAAGADVATDLAVASWEARVPLLAAAGDGPAGKLPLSQSGLALSRRGVLLTALGADPDGGKGTLLRLWDQSGVSGPLAVTLPAGMKAVEAVPVNLRGETAGPPIAVSGGVLRLNLGAYAPASYLLRK